MRALVEDLPEVEGLLGHFAHVTIRDHIDLGYRHQHPTRVSLGLVARGLGVCQVTEEALLRLQAVVGMVDEPPQLEADLLHLFPDDRVDNRAGAQFVEFLGDELAVDGGLGLDVNLAVIVEDVLDPALYVLFDGGFVEPGAEALGEGVVVRAVLALATQLGLRSLGTYGHPDNYNY